MTDTRTTSQLVDELVRWARELGAAGSPLSRHHCRVNLDEARRALDARLAETERALAAQAGG